MRITSLFIGLLLIVSCGETDQIQKTDLKTLNTGTQPDLPQMMYLNSGNIIAWWVQENPETGDNLVAYSVSENNGQSFGEPVAITQTNGINAAHGESLPAVVQKPDGTLVMVFSAKNEDAEFRFAGSVKYIQSFDQGETWSNPEIVHKTDTDKENSHSFVAAALLDDGEVGTVWLDGRHKLDHSVMYFSKTDGEKGFAEDYRIGGPTCQCCKNSMLTDQQGTLHISYRGLIEGTRDVMHVKSSDYGRTFTEPVKISEDGWKIDACPHNGPAMALAEDGSLHFLWYSLANGEGLFYAISDDGASSFTPRKQISENPVAKHPRLEVINGLAVAVWDELTGNGDNAITRVRLSLVNENDVLKSKILSSENGKAWAPNLMKLKNGEVIAMWVEQSDNKQEIFYRMIDPEFLQPETVIAEM